MSATASSGSAAANAPSPVLSTALAHHTASRPRPAWVWADSCRRHGHERAPPARLAATVKPGLNGRMRQTISLGVDDLAATRFAVSPLAETVFALQLLRSGAADPVNRPWLRWARRDLSQRTLSLPLLWPLLLDGRRSRPEFLTPAPAGCAPSLTEELEAVLATTRARFGRAGARVRSPGLRKVDGERGSAGDRPSQTLAPLAEDLASVHARLIVCTGIGCAPPRRRHRLLGSRPR